MRWVGDYKTKTYAAVLGLAASIIKELNYIFGFTDDYRGVVINYSLYLPVKYYTRKTVVELNKYALLSLVVCFLCFAVISIRKRKSFQSGKKDDSCMHVILCTASFRLSGRPAISRGPRGYNEHMGVYIRLLPTRIYTKMIVALRKRNNIYPC
jgi:hypothetical protein